MLNFCSAKCSRTSSHKNRYAKCLLSLGLCARHGKKTIETTLASYNSKKLADIADQKFVFYQRANELFSDGTSKESVVKLHGFEFYGHAENSKFQCIHDVVRHAKCKYLLFLEEDWYLYPDDPEVVRGEIMAAIDMIQSGVATVVRERSRYHSGEPNYALLAYERGGGIGSTHLLHSVHWSDDPSRLYPNEVWKCHNMPPFWCAKSKNADFTLNPIMFPVDWWRSKIAPRMPGGDFNPDTQFHDIWGSLNITVAQGMGLFMHNRLDRDPDGGM
jgi:hypothetical protein